MISARRSCFPKAVFATRPRLSILLSCMLLLVMGIAATPLHSQTYTDLHDFNCGTDGCLPIQAGILAQGRDGALYGSLYAGGKFFDGTVFKVTPAGAFAPLYNFSGADGSFPTSGLTLGTDGNFYGTTNAGGANSAGTIFKITPTGVLTMLHSFNGSDGGSPYAPPVLGKNGSYYGVTYLGTAYSISSAGTFKLLTTSIPGHSFAPLILASDGNFYGTTLDGGTVNDGTVFKMSATGTVTIVYSFDGTHGRQPYGPVVQGSDGLLYGTTTAGGSFGSAAGGVFKLSTKGVITVLHEFDAHSMTDGLQPVAGLVAATDGNFYGATTYGAPGGSALYGALFKITKSGTYSVLHLFDQTHGATQDATSMQHTNGILYGLPGTGGVASGGVFYSLAEGIPPFVSLEFPAAKIGTTLGILGQGFTTATAVTFNKTAASFTVVSDNYLTATIPTGATKGYITVTEPAGTLKSNIKFTPKP